MKPTAGDDAAAISTLRSKDEDDEENDEGKTLANTVGNDDEDADGIVISDKVEVIQLQIQCKRTGRNVIIHSAPKQSENTFLDCMNSQEVAEASLTQQVDSTVPPSIASQNSDLAGRECCCPRSDTCVAEQR